MVIITYPIIIFAWIIYSDSFRAMCTEIMVYPIIILASIIFIFAYHSTYKWYIKKTFKNGAHTNFRLMDIEYNDFKDSSQSQRNAGIAFILASVPFLIDTITNLFGKILAIVAGVFIVFSTIYNWKASRRFYFIRDKEVLRINTDKP